MLRHFFRRLGDFPRNRRGNIAILFSLLLVPITVLSGGAVDINQALNARARLSRALDAAALAVGVRTSISENEATALALDFVDANYPDREIGAIQNLTVHLDQDNDRVTVRAESRVETIILGLIGIEHITVHWESEVQRARSSLELVMVLDNTGSMGGSKISSLRSAGLLLTDILFDGADADRLKIGLVPFSATVNVGTQYDRAWWLDPDAQSPLHSENFDPSANRWDLYDSIQNRAWEGCVEARAIPHDVEDTLPTTSDPQTLFLPYFAPDESNYANNASYSNSYLNDGMGGSNERARMRNTPKYTNASINSSSRGPQWGCTARPITPLTNQRSTIDDAIEDMIANGTTNIPIGVSWGVRVLSPGMPFTEGVGFDEDDTIKAMVVLTDGENYLDGRNNPNYSNYSGYGFMRDGRLGIQSRSDNTIRNALDDRTEAACEYAKSLGIRVYTITFQVSSSSTRDMMRDCATHPSLYYDSPSDTALRSAFEMIAGDLTNLRLSR
ncbi:TadE/TadG family type IV pilus assembly protein [Maricaulis maris]|uniref:Flp pilus assembly protein TadG n=1 Tax=Maricaulis maris TaxID=74318 RepID=A0A495DMY2_9PROT|nr:TadE/TadG family type IV pilus assembly protein [Maricaulis maris]RKR03621.1 Flp pilus assembly protein TadG [Maricaulis maris]